MALELFLGGLFGFGESPMLAAPQDFGGGGALHDANEQGRADAPVFDDLGEVSTAPHKDARHPGWDAGEAPVLSLVPG